MTVEVALLISGLSLIFSVFQGAVNIRRNNKKDDRQDAMELTTVIVKLETIGAGIAEIKHEMQELKNDIKDSRERIIRVEESTKRAHERINTLEKKRGES